LLVTLAVIIERSYFFHKVLKSGLAMEHDLQMVEYQNVGKLEQLATTTKGRCNAPSSPRLGFAR